MFPLLAMPTSVSCQQMHSLQRMYNLYTLHYVLLGVAPRDAAA